MATKLLEPATGETVWLWDYLFVPQNQTTPPLAAFGLFSAIHLTVLGLLILGGVALVLAYRAADSDRRGRIRRTVGWSVLVLEVLRQLGHLILGYSPEILPLHVCAIAVFSIFVDSQRSNRWTANFLYALGWWGTLAADVFPDWAGRPILNVFTWQSFIVHALIVGYVVMLVAAGDLVPAVQDLWRAGVIVVVFGTVAYLANQMWGTNFWFLNTGAPGSPLEGIQNFAGSGYLPVLVMLLAIVWAGLYAPWIVRAHRMQVQTM